VIEISVVLPCLNEEATIADCVKKAQSALGVVGIEYEIIVADNGSTDRSVEISEGLGARIVTVEDRGYGACLRGGITAARGKYIIMGDADDTYDFSEIGKFVQLLREGYDLVIGSRFRGKIMPGAMSWSHRHMGNPILSRMLRRFFGGSISDAHCGLRAFTKEAYYLMDLHTTGMEFASEMVIHALKKGLKITEVPITYYPRRGQSKLSSFRDAWRHIRFMLLYSPNNLYFVPGGILFAIGLFLVIRLMFGPIWLFGRMWGIHVMLYGSMMTLLGWQILTLGLCAKVYARQIGLEEESGGPLSWFTLERALTLGGILALAGFGFAVYIFIKWVARGFGELAEVQTAVFSLTLLVIGVQTIFSAFLSGLFQVKYRT